jgi:hypothetical protein
VRKAGVPRTRDDLREIGLEDLVSEMAVAVCHFGVMGPTPNAERRTPRITAAA